MCVRNGFGSFPLIVFAGDTNFVFCSVPQRILTTKCTFPIKEIPCKYSDKQASASVMRPAWYSSLYLSIIYSSCLRDFESQENSIFFNQFRSICEFISVYTLFLVNINPPSNFRNWNFFFLYFIKHYDINFSVVKLRCNFIFPLNI